MDITELLREWSDGSPEALGQLMPLVVGELKKVARGHFAREPAGHTLQPTALVNEVFIRLQKQHNVHLESRAQFLAFAANLMRRVLVDHARGRHAQKRGGDVVFVPLEDLVGTIPSPDVDLLALDEAMKELAEMDPEGCRVVELRFFAGLTHQQIADLDGVSLSSVRRKWRAAKLWLFRELSRGGSA